MTDQLATDRLATGTAFDWDTFTDRYWDRQPVLYKAIGTAPADEREVFDAAVLAGRSPHPLAMPPDVQFFVERRQQTRPRDYLPAATDGSFDGYQRRLADRLAGQRYALVLHRFHTRSHPQWARGRDFWAGLWRRVGQPGTTAITTVFHGSYEHSPVGVHRDRFATFMYVLRGTKRMRFWPERPWTEPVTTILDYAPYLDGSLVAEVEAGDLLYWPSRYYHVGESAGDAPATSINIGVPRTGHRAAYEIDDLLDGTVPAVTAPLLAPPTAGDRLPATLPAPLTEALDALTAALSPAHLTARLTARSPARRAGFWPSPPHPTRAS